MADASITLTVLRGSIPSACYVQGGLVSAQVVLVDGLFTLPLEISSIETGEGDTDVVTFIYDDSVVPPGIVLSECNFSSFQCVCDACAEKRCFQVVATSDEVTDGSVHVGFLPGRMIVDQIRVYSPSPSGSDFHFVLYANGHAVTQSTETTGSPTVIERADFTSTFESGVLVEDTELFVIFNAAPTGGEAWRGFSLCLLGRWLT